MIGEPFGRDLGSYLGSLSQFNNVEPYDLSLGMNDTTSRMLYSTASMNPLVFASQFPTLPIKATLIYNAARSTWYASRALGITSSTKNIFDPRMRMFSKKATTVTGLLGDIVNDIGDRFTIRSNSGPFKSRLFNTYKNMFSRARSKGFFGGMREILSGGRTSDVMNQTMQGELAASRYGNILNKRVYQPWMDEAARLSGKPNILQKKILGTSSIIDELRSINPSMADRVAAGGGEERLTYEIMRNINKLQTGKAPWIKNTVGVSKYAEELSAFQSGNRFSVGNYLKQGVKRLFGGKDVSEITQEAIDVAKGRSAKKFMLMSFGKRAREQAAVRGLAMNQALKSIIEEGTTTSVRRGLGNIMDAAGLPISDEAYTVMKKVIKPTPVEGIDDAARKVVMNSMLTQQSRIRALRFTKAVGAVGIIGGAAAAAAKVILKSAIEIPERTAATMRELTRPDFGSGQVLTNTRISTDRQRAVQAIQGAQMNARYLMGSEAEMYHY